MDIAHLWGANRKGSVMSTDVSSVQSALQMPATHTLKPEAVIATHGGAAPASQQTQPSPGAAELPKQADPATLRKKLAEAVDHLNEMAQRNNYKLNFSIDEQSNQVIVRVRDAKSGEVIRQMPNEAALRMAHHFADLKGLLSDEKI